MKKLILMLLALNIVGAFLAGCASDPAAETTPEETTTPDPGPEGK